MFPTGRAIDARRHGDVAFNALVAGVTVGF